MPETKHADIVAQQVLADSATFTSESQNYNAEEVIVAACVNGTPQPLQQCRVTLELSADDVAWSRGDNKPFGAAEGMLHLAKFVLSDYAATGAWRHWRLTFGGHVGGSVTVAASTGECPVYVPPEPPAPPEARKAKAAHEEPKSHHAMK